MPVTLEPVEHYICRWNSVDRQKEWLRRGTPVEDPEPPPPPPGPTGDAKFPGHTPNQVEIGMATPRTGAASTPGWDEARTIIGQPIYEARRFVGGWITQNSFDQMVGEADAANALGWISFKVPGGSNATGWGQVRDGVYDTDLEALFSMMQVYGKNVLVTFEHEPAGASISNADLGVWAQMQTRLAYYFAGHRSCTVSSSGIVTLGPYVAAHDLSLNNGGNAGWAPIGNGFWWRSMNSATLRGQREAAWPTHLTTALNLCYGVHGNDFYDADYVDQQRALTDPAFRVAGNGVRTYERLVNYCEWARQVGANASGAGEYGVIDGAEMRRCWEVMRANRDIWCIGNYFNSQNNSDHEWRVVTSDYPAGNPTGSKGLVDYGGDAQSQGRLDEYRITLTESRSATYTGPLI